MTISYIWLISVGCTLPYANAVRFDASDQFQCEQRWSYEADFNFATVYFCVILLPTILIAFLYAKCTLKLRKNMRALRNSPDVILRRIIQNKRLDKLFIVIVGVFTILTTPYFIFYIVVNYYLAYDPQIIFSNIELISGLNHGLFTLATFNSVVNLFVYAKIQGFRKIYRPRGLSN